MKDAGIKVWVLTGDKIETAVNIGLSAGFIEPLESTGIALICEGVGTACNVLESGYWREHDVEYFNAWMKQCFEVCSDFVSMHYSKSTKDTPFWRYVRETFRNNFFKNENFPFESGPIETGPMCWDAFIFSMFLIP